MKFKTILFVSLFLYAAVLTYQATLDAQQEGIIDRAREAERKALGELKLQYENAKQQFKTAFKKVKGTNPPPEDTSDSDSVIQKAITAAETAADSVKAGEWKSVSALKAQLQKAKEVYKAAVSKEQSYIDELKVKAKNAKQQFKAAFNKARGVSNVDSSDSDAVIQEEIKTAETASDANAANEWKGLSTLKEQAQKAKDAYKSAKANLKSRTDSLTEEARAAEHKAVSELKAQAKNAKEQFKATFKKLKGTRASSSDSSDSDAAIQKGITEADTASDTTKSNEWKAVSELKAQAQKAKEAYRAAKADLKSRIKKTRESSDSSSDSSDSSDSDDAVDKVKHAAEWGVITALKSQAKKAKQVAKQAYNKLKNLYRSEKESDSSSDSSDGVVKEAAEAAGEKAAETVTEKAVEEAQSLLEQARNAQITAYLELKEGAKRAKDTFKNAYRDLKAKIRGEKTAEPAKPQVETDL